jgi:hypothetical protein
MLAAEWKYEVALGDLFAAEDMPFLARRDAFVERIRNSTWWADHHDELDTVVNGLAHSDDEAEFDDYLDDLYDLADVQRCWLSPFTS